MESNRRLDWSFLGRVGYAPAMALQESIREAVRDGRGREHLLLLEHPPVYTLGRKASPSDIVAAPEWLAARGIEVVECDRGGQVTYHGPGQLVGYPVIDLSPDRRDVRRYVRDLQTVLVDTLADFGVEARGESEPERIGVWVAEAKIASIGIHLSRWITTHGFALNVSTDLGDFDGIVACGLAEVPMTSIERVMARAPDLDELAVRLAHRFGEVFERELDRREPESIWNEHGGAPRERAGAAEAEER